MLIQLPSMTKTQIYSTFPLADIIVYTYIFRIRQEVLPFWGCTPQGWPGSDQIGSEERIRGTLEVILAIFYYLLFMLNGYFIH